MGKATFTLLAVLLFTGLSQARAQSRMEAGLFLDYLNVSQTRTPNVGLGGRFGYRFHSNVMFEGEFAYDYGVNFNELYVDVINGKTAAISRTSIGVTNVLFGPMLQPAHGHFRPFVTVKGGFVDFRLSPSLIPYGNVVSSVLGIRTSNVNTALYPGAGAELSLGPVGLRLEFGDLVYFNSGGHNNLRITFGPILRF
ncbi:MAG TPA: outer membrane beta-barrel protein [Terracidiphilus sp.]